MRYSVAPLGHFKKEIYFLIFDCKYKAIFIYFPTVSTYFFRINYNIQTINNLKTFLFKKTENDYLVIIKFTRFMIKQILYLFICISLLNSCKKENNEKKVIQNDVFHFAKNISINESEKIISISGKPGLFTLVTQLRSGFIVEDISTGKKASISNSSQVSLLDNIAIYTFDKEVPLFEVFKNVAEKYNYEQTIAHKSSENELRAFMNSVLPDYDTDRVYPSDIKKLVQWYNLLQKAGIINKDAFIKAEEETTVTDAEVVEETKAEKKPTAKKAAPKTEKTVAPKAKASSAAKSSVKSTQRKQG